MRVDLERRDNREQRGVLVGQHLSLGVGVAEGDRVVGVDVRGHRRESDRRSTGAHLEGDAEVLTVKHHWAAHDLVRRIDGVALTDQVVQSAVLGLWEPVGLDDDGGRADIGEDSVAATGRRIVVATAGSGDKRECEEAGGDSSRSCSGHLSPPGDGC